MALNKKKSNKRLIISIAIAIILIVGIVTGFAIYKNMTGKLYSGEGKYYSQQDEGKYLQFNKDNTFTYVNRVNENTEDVSKGTWAEDGNKIVLTYTESGKSYTFIKSEDGYIYREDSVFRGKTSDDKLLNNRFVLEKDGEVVEEMWFLKDGTMDRKIIGDTKMSYGTYTRVDDILIVRYDDNPDKAERFLVLENGITKDIYNKEPAKKVTE